jgi:hypothetical protein
MAQVSTRQADASTLASNLNAVRLPRPVARLLVNNPPLVRGVSRASQPALILARVRAVGMPEMATREDVLRSPAKRKMVAKAVYDELVGMQESECRIHGGKGHTRPVEDHFPGGYKEVEPLVEQAATSRPDAGSPSTVTLRRIGKELQR